jgi:hypothetical protein
MNIAVEGTQKVLLVENSENINLLTESNSVNLSLAGTTVQGVQGPSGIVNVVGGQLVNIGSYTNANIGLAQVSRSDLYGDNSITFVQSLNSDNYGRVTGLINSTIRSAEYTQLGIASFDSGDFNVNSGFVSIKPLGIDNAQLAGNIDPSKITGTAVVTGDSRLSPAAQSTPSIRAIAGTGSALTVAASDHTHTQSQIGLSNVTNTSDATKFSSNTGGYAATITNGGAPIIDGTAAVGTSNYYARADHVHPTDTSRQAASVNLTTPADANVASIRAIGTGATDAAAGNHTHTTISNDLSLNGDLNINGHKLIGLGQPTADSDAARKIDVDTAAAGLNIKDPVQAATTENIAYPFTASSIDTVSLSAGNRVLVKDQYNKTQNGIWVVGSPWTRATDASTWSSPTDTAIKGAYVLVLAGTQINSGFLFSGALTGSIGTTNITFAKFTTVGNITAGYGLSKSGDKISANGSSTINIDPTDGSLINVIVKSGGGVSGGVSSALNGLYINTGAISNDMLAGGIQIGASGSKVTGILPINNGGTGTNNTNQGYAFIGPASGSGNPSFRPLAEADIPDNSISGGTTGTGVKIKASTITGANLATGAVDLSAAANKVTGTLPVASGGTGATSIPDIKTGLSIDQVNNTSDDTKATNFVTSGPIKDALDLKAPLDSPSLTGVPIVPTASSLTSTDQVASTLYADTAVAAEALERQKGDLTVLSSVAETGAGWGFRQQWHVNKLKVGGSGSPIANQVVSIDISNKAKSYPGSLFVTDTSVPQKPLLTTIEKQSGHLHLSDGGWCWFNDPRAICVRTPLGKNLIITSHVSTDGSTIVAQYNIDTGISTSVNLHSQFEDDDHDAPGLILMPSGKIRAYYSTHSHERIIRWRESPTAEGIDGTWTTEATIPIVGSASGNMSTVFLTGITSTSGVFSKASHGLTNGTPVILFNLVGGSSLDDDIISPTTYYIINATTSTFQLSTSINGSAAATGGNVTSGTVIGAGNGGVCYPYPAYLSSEGKMYLFFRRKIIGTNGSGIEKTSTGTGSEWDHSRWFITSTDLGVTWSAPKPIIANTSVRNRTLINVTGNATSKTFTSNSPDMPFTDAAVKLSFLNGGSNLNTSTTYYIINKNQSAQTFQLSTSVGGSAVSLGSTVTSVTVTPVTWPSTADGNRFVMRPYLQITDNGIDRIDLVFTDGHPDEYDSNNPYSSSTDPDESGPGTSLYHAYIKNNNVYTSNGTQMVSLANLGTTTGTYYEWGLDFKNHSAIGSGLVSFTKIQDVATQSSSSLGSSCWGWDLTRNDSTGEINVVFARFPRTSSTATGQFGAVHEYWHARYAPSFSSWVTNKITDDAGTYIAQDVFNSSGVVTQYAGGQPHYSGGISIDKDDPTIVYASVFLGTAAGYGTRGKDATFEVQKYTTDNDGLTWSFDSRLTGHGRRSQTKATRPVTPRWRSRLNTTNVIPDVFWQEGRYHNYMNSGNLKGYQCQVYSYPEPASETSRVVLKSQITSMNSTNDFPGYVYLNTANPTTDTDPYPTTNILRKHLYGVKFDGTNYASIDAVDLSTATASLIISCRFKVTASIQQYLVSNWTGTNSNTADVILRISSAGKFEAFLTKADGTTASCSFDPPVTLSDSLHTAVFAYDSTNGFRLWIDGQRASITSGSTNTTGLLNSHKSYQPFYFGATPHGTPGTGILNGNLEQVTIWGSSNTSTPALTDAQILTLSNEPITILDAGEAGGTAITPAKLAGAPTLTNGQSIAWNTTTNVWDAASFVKTSDSVSIPDNSISMDKLSKGSATTASFDNFYIGWDNTNSKFVPRTGTSVNLTPYDRTQGQPGLVLPSAPFTNGSTTLTIPQGRVYYVRGFTSKAMLIKNIGVIVATAGAAATLEVSMFNSTLSTRYGAGTINIASGTTTLGYQTPSSNIWSSGQSIAAGTAFYLAIVQVTGTTSTIQLAAAAGTHLGTWTAFCSNPIINNSTNVSTSDYGTFDGANTSGTFTTSQANPTLIVSHSAYPLLFARE